jgi:universal stress protein A
MRLGFAAVQNYFDTGKEIKEDKEVFLNQEGENFMFAPKSILVPTDFSEHSDKAIKQAADIAEQNSSKIYLLHVVDWPQQCAVDYCIAEETIQAVVEKSKNEATKKMKEEVEKVLRTKKIDISFEVKSGVPHQEILKEQAEKKVDLIVIGSRGRTGIARILVGSVADRVLHDAKCPVLLVR